MTKGAQLRDSVTRVELVGYEDLGFAERFGARGVNDVDAVTILEGLVADGR